MANMSILIKCRPDLIAEVQRGPVKVEVWVGKAHEAWMTKNIIVFIKKKKRSICKVEEADTIQGP